MKIRYMDRATAKTVRRRMKAHGLKEKLNVYRCPFCDMWHLGGKGHYNITRAQHRDHAIANA